MRTMTLLALLALGLVATAGFLRADDPPAPVPAPADDATKANVDRWIADLGSDDFRTREEASRRLAGVGAAAKKALEDALAKSESLEVRWRVEQLLRRLAGRAEKPLEVPPGDEGQTEDAGATDLRQELERWADVFRSRFDAFRGMGPLGGSRLEAPGLVLERRSPFGPASLRVTTKDATGVEKAREFLGRDLAAILAANPELADHPGMAELKKKDEESRRGFQGFSIGGPGLVFRTSGVEYREDGTGVTAKVREIGEDGKEVVKEYKAATKEDLLREHPELKDKLGGFSIQLGGFGAPVVVGRGGFPRGLEPVAPAPPPPPMPLPQEEAKVSDGPFGVVVGEPERILSLHLAIDPARTLLVHSVRPGSPAETLGVKPYDVIVEIDGQPLASRDAGVEALRDAARSRRPISLGIIRQGQRQTLP
jgi:hypothetical protein